MTKMRTLTDKVLSQVLHDMKTGRLPVERQSLRDTEVPGLRATVYKTGSIQYGFRWRGAEEFVHVPAASLVEARRMVTSA